MKKILGLVMALVMILTAVSAFAAVPSIATANLATVTTTSKNVTVKATDNNSEVVTELLKTLIADNSIPAAAQKALPEGSNYTKIVEAVTLKVEGGTAEEDLVINLKFPTDFTGKDVAILLAIVEGGQITEWKSVETTGKDDTSIDLVLDGVLQDWLNGREFIALIAE